MASSSDRYHQALQDIRAHALAASRAADSVSLLAVSKRQTTDAIRQLAQCGQRAFGENYAQEAIDKIVALEDLALQWHFIGPLQSNKAAVVAEKFDWVHSVDRKKIAQKLNDARPASLSPLNVCIQVNISGESSKNGVAPAQLAELVACISDFGKLKLRGLMALPAPTPDVYQQRKAFAALRELSISVLGKPIDTLSMGTSSDYPAAIAEGATMVRLGTALFGPREN